MCHKYAPAIIKDCVLAGADVCRELSLAAWRADRMFLSKRPAPRSLFGRSARPLKLARAFRIHRRVDAFSFALSAIKTGDNLKFRRQLRSKE